VTLQLSPSSHFVTMLGGELFRGLPQPELRQLVAAARRRRFTRNEVVFHRGDPADTLHLILRGRFAARLETETGERVTASVHGPGDAFGELALLDLEHARSSTVAALEEGETYAVHRDDFTRLRQQYPSVNDVLARLLAARVRRMSELLSEAFSVPAERRVLRRLVELASLYGEGVVNRVLRGEEKRGTVELRRGQTVVVDPSALARRAGGPSAR
jgi:CRP/FNR family transcriptional regulator, cyclic AMP receptor protein